MAKPFDRYRSRVGALGSVGDEPIEHDGEGYYLTGEQLLALVWKAAGATMAALGVERDELRWLGEIVAPTIHGLVREYGITIPEDARG